MGAEFHLLSAGARRHARRIEALLQPKTASLHRQFTRTLRLKNFSREAIRALTAVTPAAAAACRSHADFLEQVEYNGRRLAKLNAAPGEVLDALRAFGDLIEPLVDEASRPALEQLDLATRLTINQAYYQVREAETQALFGIYRAEIEARDLDDFLRRLIRVLTAAVRARAGRIVERSASDPKLDRAAYIERGSPGERLIADPAMHGKYASYWSYPLSARFLAQFGFTVKYPWLPRELTLLDAAAELCRSTEERQRLRSDNLRLAAEARRAEEEERVRIGRELHDEAGQSLLLLRLQLEMMERQAAPELREPLGNARVVTESVITEIRRIVSALGPQVLERLGLSPALRQLGARFQKMHSARLRMLLPKRLPQLPPRVEQTVYRVCQECFLNIAKHSTAKAVKLSLRVADSTLRLCVSDDGSGFDGEDAARKPLSYGLAGMRERAALLGGNLEISSAPGKGVTVKLELPLERRPIG